MRVTRTASTILAAALILSTAATPALAAPPSNDTFDNPIAITQVPSGTLLDTREATTDAIDEQVKLLCGIQTVAATAWYTYTAPADAGLRLSILGSSYSGGIAVVTGAPGSFTREICDLTTIFLAVDEGVTYHIMIYDDDSTTNGGDMTLGVNYHGPFPPKLTFTVNQTATHNPQTGSATVSGTIMCTGAVHASSLHVELRQRIGPGEVVGTNSMADLRICGDVTRPWSLIVVPETGTRFIGGHATLITTTAICGTVFCRYQVLEHTVQLKRRG